MNLCRGTEVLHERFDLRGSAERVARALHEQHRLLDVFEVLDAQLRRLAGWMQRVTEEHETYYLVSQRFDILTRHHLRRDASAHRLPANHHAIALQLLVFERGFDHRPKT